MKEQIALHNEKILSDGEIILRGWFIFLGAGGERITML